MYKLQDLPGDLKWYIMAMLPLRKMYMLKGLSQSFRDMIQWSTLKTVLDTVHRKYSEEVYNHNKVNGFIMGVYSPNQDHPFQVMACDGEGNFYMVMKLQYPVDLAASDNGMLWFGHRRTKHGDFYPNHFYENLSHNRMPSYLINPSSGGCVEVPPLPGTIDDSLDSCGMHFDPATNQYTLVKSNVVRYTSNAEIGSINVFSTKTNEWDTIWAPNIVAPDTDRPFVYSNGYVYWTYISEFDNQYPVKKGKIGALKLDGLILFTMNVPNCPHHHPTIGCVAKEWYLHGHGGAVFVSHHHKATEREPSSCWRLIERDWHRQDCATYDTPSHRCQPMFSVVAEWKEHPEILKIASDEYFRADIFTDRDFDDFRKDLTFNFDINGKHVLVCENLDSVNDLVRVLDKRARITTIVRKDRYQPGLFWSMQNLEMNNRTWPWPQVAEVPTRIT